MSHHRSYQNPINNAGFAYGQPQKGSRRVDGLPHVCADGHNHATEVEVQQCIEAHRVFVCSSNHFHTATNDAERCDQIKREEEAHKEKECERIHEREMMDKQIKFANELRGMGYDFKRHGPMNRLQLEGLHH